MDMTTAELKSLILKSVTFKDDGSIGKFPDNLMKLDSALSTAGDWMQYLAAVIEMNRTGDIPNGSGFRWMVSHAVYKYDVAMGLAVLNYEKANLSESEYLIRNAEVYNSALRNSGSLD